MNRNRWIVLGASMLMVFIVIALVRSGRGTPDMNAKAGKTKASKRGYYVPPKTPPAPAAPDAMASAVVEARVRSAYQNYRSAVALGHRRLMESFRRALLRESGLAVRIAEEELAAAKDQTSREIAQKALEGLRP